MSAPRGAEEGIVLPERLETRAPFGPFPSGGDALKFLLVSAVGALVGLRFGALLWTPFLAAGFLVAVHRRDGLSLDERAGHYLAWRWRSLRPRSSVARPGAAGVGSIVRSAHGRWAAAFETGGIPIAFLPTEVARRVYEVYRQLLRSTELSIHLCSTRSVIRAEPFLPRVLPAGESERSARAGYQEFVRLLSRRRQRRRCRVLLVSGPDGGVAAHARLQAALETWTGTLTELEIPVRRLRGSELAALVGRMGAGVGA
ncbi:MAG TPA: hypothetical protein VGV89_10895 [Thermoplasmata archaeon]|nr:hypothetical protein [Thermoplasmata archaeon]